MKHIFLIVFSLLPIFSISQTNTKLYPISDGSKYALINREREKVTDYIYDYISPFKEGYAIIQRDQKYGMINSKGKETIIPRFDKIELLNQGLTIVTLNDSCTVVDSIGNCYTNQWYFHIDTPLNDFFRVIIKIKTGAGVLIKNTIKYYHLENIIGLSRDSVLFSEYLIGYISRKKSTFNGLWFSGGEKFQNGKAKVAISKQTFFIDTSGVITPRKPDDCDLSLMNIFFPDEYPQYPGGNSGFSELITKNLKYPEYSETKFHNSEVIVSFIIDKSGQVVLPKIEKSLHPAFDSVVITAVMKSEKWVPAKYNGEPVCFQIQFPVRFNIRNLK